MGKDDELCLYYLGIQECLMLRLLTVIFLRYLGACILQKTSRNLFVVYWGNGTFVLSII